MRKIYLMLLMVCFAAGVNAQRFAAFVNGAQETPPNGSLGTGYGYVILNDAQTLITVNLGFTGLGTTATAAHIHTAPVGVAGSVTFGLTGVPTATAGVIPEQTFAISASQVADLLAGKMYFNIHTVGFGGGEIRGQILLATCSTAGPIEVNATAGTLGPTAYGTLKLAFDAINAGTHQGAINIQVCASTVEGTTPATLNSTGAGSASYTEINIYPLANGVSISGNPVTGFGVIQLKGADNVTIDGDNPNTGGTNRNLTVNNTTTATVIANSCIRIATAATVTSADNITIRNCILNGNVTAGNASGITTTASSSNSSFGIYCGGNGGATATDAPTAITSVTANSAPSGTTINSLLIDNNAVNQCARGIVFIGAATTVSTGVTITNNLIGEQATVLSGAPPYTSPGTSVYTNAIYVAGTNAIAISGNTIKNILSYVGTQMNGIELNTAIGTGVVNVSGNSVIGVVNNGTASAAITIGIDVPSAAAGATLTVSGNTVTNIQTLADATTVGINLSTSATAAKIDKNKVTTVYSRGAGGLGSYGINFGGNNVTVQNNFVSDINAFLNNVAISTSFGPHGIRIASGTGHKIYHNSVNLFGAFVGSSSVSMASALTVTPSGSTGMDIRNNILVNTMTGAPAGTPVDCIALPSGLTNTFGLTDNNNAYYSNSQLAQQGTAAVSGFTIAAFNPSTTIGANNWRNYTSTLLVANTNNDNASLASTSAAPFTAANDLHINISSGGAAALNNHGMPVGITQDIDNQTRDLLIPDIGADEFVVATTNVWTGATSTNWSLAANWSLGFVPNASENANIPFVVNLPVLTVPAAIKDINMAASAYVDISGQSFTINGAVTGSATLTGSPASNLIINGAAGTIKFTPTSALTRSLNNLTLGATATATLGSSLDVFGTIDLETTAGGNLNLNGQSLTLKSTATGTARVGKLTPFNTSVLGGATAVTVERYINSNVVGRKWHLLSGIATTTAQTILASWQEGGGAPVTANIGTWITAQSLLPGYDGTSIGTNASILSHNPAGPSWVNLPATNSGSINAQRGYFLFVRGDRFAQPPPNVLQAQTVLRTTGSLNLGTQPAVTVLGVSPGYTIMGNPFASPIDMDSVLTTANLGQFFYVWDASLAGTNSVGKFRLVQKTGPGAYTATPSTGGTDNTTRYIHSGQAFMLKASGVPNASVVLDEYLKTNLLSVINPIVSTAGNQQIYTELLIADQGSTEYVTDAVRVWFNDTYSAGTGDDILKMGNFSDNISSYREGKKLIVENRPMIVGNDTIFLRTSGLSIHNYRLRINTFDFVQTNVKAWLQDIWLNTNTPLELDGNIVNVDFKVTSDPASTNPDRFRIIFAAAAPTPAAFTSVKAVQQNNNIAVDWKVTNQGSIAKYEVEKSTDGINFTKVNTQTAITGTDAAYAWLDVNPILGDNYYRIRSIGIGSEVKISQVVKVTMGKGIAPSITVYPNPVANKNMTVLFTNMDKGTYQLRLINTNGAVVRTQQLTHSGGNAVQSVVLSRSIAPGTYQLEVINPDKSRSVRVVVITN